MRPHTQRQYPNQPICRTCNVARKRKRENESGKRKGWNIYRKYGITKEDYDKTLEDQNGVCAICQRKENTIHPSSGKLKPLAIDHNATTGKVRGLLCQRCNLGIGQFKENPDLLKAAIDYLRYHES